MNTREQEKYNNQLNSQDEFKHQADEEEWSELPDNTQNKFNLQNIENVDSEEILYKTLEQSIASNDGARIPIFSDSEGVCTTYKYEHTGDNLYPRMMFFDHRFLITWNVWDLRSKTSMVVIYNLILNKQQKVIYCEKFFIYGVHYLPL